LSIVIGTDNMGNRLSGGEKAFWGVFSADVSLGKRGRPDREEKDAGPQ
jgi:hypothetical protein